MFVKVHVSYGDGERSSPQDLLLYDSQCWHCSLTGECNAKPNNKCVFSAGASNVQSFRIGKSISRTEGIVLFCLVIIQLLRHNLQLSSKSPFQKISCAHSLTTRAAVTGRSSDITTTHLRYVINKTDC